MIREIIESTEVAGRSYEIWFVNKGTLEDNVDLTERELLSITGDTKGQPLSDEIRNSPTYKKAKLRFDKAFKELQQFNKNSPKEFLKRERKERRGY